MHLYFEKTQNITVDQVTHQVTHQVEDSPEGGLAQPQ